MEDLNLEVGPFDSNMRGGVRCPSMARPLWFVELLKKAFPSRSMIAKATKVPMIGRIVDKLLFEGDNILYLPKDDVVEKTIQINQRLD
ncbi:hypothetical protein EU524_00730, partial [Candidatus Thorarchaeota archaeon]